MLTRENEEIGEGSLTTPTACSNIRCSRCGAPSINLARNNSNLNSWSAAAQQRVTSMTLPAQHRPKPADGRGM
jgi:hypothetical protein